MMLLAPPRKSQGARRETRREWKRRRRVALQAQRALRREARRRRRRGFPAESGSTHVTSSRGRAPRRAGVTPGFYTQWGQGRPEAGRALNRARSPNLQAGGVCRLDVGSGHVYGTRRLSGPGPLTPSLSGPFQSAKSVGQLAAQLAINWTVVFVALEAFPAYVRYAGNESGAMAGPAKRKLAGWVAVGMTLLNNVALPWLAMPEEMD